MLNPYTVVLGLFIVAGAATTLWGWWIIRNARQSLRWPTEEGAIEHAEAQPETDDLLPRIEFSYTVSDQRYLTAVHFPSGTTPTPELSRQYLEKYPVGRHVTVYYDPQRPQHATLEPGMAQGDWMIFALGLIATAIGIAMLLSSI